MATAPALQVLTYPFLVLSVAMLARGWYLSLSHPAGMVATEVSYHVVGYNGLSYQPLGIAIRRNAGAVALLTLLGRRFPYTRYSGFEPGQDVMEVLKFLVREPKLIAVLQKRRARKDEVGLTCRADV